MHKVNEYELNKHDNVTGIMWYNKLNSKSLI